MSTTCGHERAFLSHAVRPVPDAWYPCPDCGEYVGLRNGRAITIRENNELARVVSSDEATERLLVCDKCAAIWSWDRDDNDPFTSYEYEIGTEHAGCGGRKREPGDDRLNAGGPTAGRARRPVRRDDLAGQRRFIWQQKNEIRARAGQMMAHWEDECWPLMVEDAEGIRAAAQKLRCLAQWRGAQT